MPRLPKTFEYTRAGHVEVGRYHDGLHLAVVQPDGTTATTWLTAEEATGLGRRLLGMAADAATVREHDHG